MMIQKYLYDLRAACPHRYFIFLHGCISRFYLIATYRSVCCVGVLLVNKA